MTFFVFVLFIVAVFLVLVAIHGSEHVGGEGDSTVWAWRHWEGLLQRQRRALHFGVGSSDRGHAKEIRALQGLDEPTDGTQQEESTPADPGRSERG